MAEESGFSRDLRGFLVRAVLDLEFRKRALSAPDEAFEGYTLTDEEKATLRRGDAAILSLLGRAHEVRTEEGAAAPAPAASSPLPEPPPALPALPELAFLVRLSPRAIRADDGWRVAWAASIHPAPASVVPEPPRPAPAPVWSHADSPAARAAAEAVLAASPGERHARVLDLVRALVRP